MQTQHITQLRKIQNTRKRSGTHVRIEGHSTIKQSTDFVPLNSFGQPALGTNPISVAAPGLNGDSFVLDMATSAVSYGKVFGFGLDVYNIHQGPIF